MNLCKKIREQPCAKCACAILYHIPCKYGKLTTYLESLAVIFLCHSKTENKHHLRTLWTGINNSFDRIEREEG